MNLLTLRDGIVTDIRTRFGTDGLKLSIEGHGGRFDFDELDNYAVKAPEVRVAILTAPRSEKGRNCYVDARCAAYVIAGGDRLMKAGDRGLVIGSAIAQYLSNNAPGGGDRPSAIAWQNLYDGGARTRAMHLGAVTWTQRFEITDQDQAAVLVPFETAIVEYDLGADGQIEATDTIELEQDP